jgi:hypothetical protein
LRFNHTGCVCFRDIGGGAVGPADRRISPDFVSAMFQCFPLAIEEGTIRSGAGMSWRSITTCCRLFSL